MLSFAVFAKIYLGSYFGKGIEIVSDLSLYITHSRAKAASPPPKKPSLVLNSQRWLTKLKIWWLPLTKEFKSHIKLRAISFSKVTQNDIING